MQHDISSAHKLAHLILDNPEYLLYILGSIGGAIWWGLHKVFTTHTVMRECKNELVEALERHEHEETLRADQRQLSDAEQHQIIRQDIRELRDHILNNKD